MNYQNAKGEMTMGKAKTEETKPEAEKINKSEIIRQAIKDPKWQGDNIGLAKFLTEHHGQEFTPTMVGSIRSKSKEGGGGIVDNGKADKPAKKKAAAATESVPFMEQLKQLKGMIGADGVKKLVDGL